MCLYVIPTTYLLLSRAVQTAVAAVLQPAASKACCQALQFVCHTSAQLHTPNHNLLQYLQLCLFYPHMLSQPLAPASAQQSRVADVQRASALPFLPLPQPMEIFVDDEAKLTLHGLVQHYIMLHEEEKNRKLTDLLDALDFNQVGARAACSMALIGHDLFQLQIHCG